MTQRELAILEANERAFVGWWHDVVITIWRGDVTAEDVRRSSLAQLRAAEHTGRFAALAYVETRTLRVSETARSEAARVTAEAAGRLTGVAVVLPAEGFHGAIARTVASAIHLASRSRCPQRVFRSPMEAAPWLFERLGRRDDATAFDRVIEEARTTVR